MKAKITLKKPDYSTTGWTTITGNIKIGIKYVHVVGITNVPFFKSPGVKYYTKIQYNNIKTIEFE